MCKYFDVMERKTYINEVINGRRYNTKTATFLAAAEVWSKTSLYGSIDATYEALYRKHNGEYFIVEFLVDQCDITPVSEITAKNGAKKFAPWRSMPKSLVNNQIL